MDLRYLRRLTRCLLQDELHLDAFELGVCLLNDQAMVQANEQFLRHAGTTDVITFDYSEPGSDGLIGEILVCIPEAARQARRFRTSWESELVRYIVHGVLHLRGFDDTTTAKRRRMKARENKLVRRLKTLFRFERVGGRHSPCIPPALAARHPARQHRA